MTNQPPQSLECPNCGAAIRWKDQPTVTCEYCGSEVIIPAELREPSFSVSEQPPRIHVTVIAPPHPPPAIAKPAKTTSAVPIVFATFLLMIAFVALGIFIAARQSNFSAELMVTAQAAAVTLAAPPATPTPAYAPLLRFGEEGSDSGQFTDARYLSIAPNDTIWVAEYDSGRVQQFSPEGKYQRTVLVSAKIPMTAKFTSTALG